MATLLQLGPHQFEILPLNYQKLAQDAEFRWPSLARLGREPARQFIGPGEKKLTVSGPPSTPSRPSRSAATSTGTTRPSATS